MRSEGLPNATLASGTTNTTLSLVTDENATCRYSASAGTPYSGMTALDVTGTTTHNHSISGLSDGNSYAYHIRCQDGAGNTNDDDYSISFSVAAAPATHEPSGFTRLSEHTFASEEEDGWFSEGSFGGVYSDATSPGSAPSVLRATFPTGFAAGSAPGNLDLQVTGSPTRLYGRFWVKLSSNWYGQESGTNKITYAWIDNGPDFFISAEGNGNGPLELYGRMQGTTDTPDDRYLPPNQGDGTLSRGDWHLVEYLLGSNTGANPDGTLEMWLDGALTHNYTDLRFNDFGGKTWEWVEIFPIWGGTGSTVPATQYLSLEDYYVSTS